MANRAGPDERKPHKGRDQKPDPHAREKAEELAKQGMPMQMALAVAHGRMALSEAVEKMARRDKVNRMMEKHALSRALATQIALGQASLEQVLAQRRLQEHREGNRARSVLDEAVASQAPLTLLLHGHRRVTGKVLLVDAYMFRLEKEDGTTEDVHKLQAKVAFQPDAYKRVRKVIKFDKELEKSPKPPIAKPQDRYTCSDRRLFRYLDSRADVVATTLEGEVFRGTVEWFSRYEFGLGLKGDATVVIFRHALHDLAEG